MYCLDTYALWEINYGNEKFKFLLNKSFIVTDWTLLEFYRGILREYDKKTAEYWLRRLRPFSKWVDIDTLIEAASFQHENKKKRMSLFDCVGYVYSKRNNYIFVTGDKEFRNRKGVHFVQK